MLSIKDVTYGYAANYKVLSNFSLEFGEGGIYGLLGKNGTGKSTLLYLIMGLLHPNKGEVLYNGVDTRLRNPDIMSDMFIVPEEYNLPAISLKEYINSLRRFYPRFSEDTLKRCLDGFGMPLEVNLGALSMGQKKKVYMCMALAANTGLLLMDEPFGALDAQTRTQLQTELLKTWEEEKKTCFFITHDVEEAILLATKVIVMSARPGRIKEIIDIDIPYPRGQESKMLPRFTELKNYIWNMVYKEYLEVQK